MTVKNLKYYMANTTCPLFIVPLDIFYSMILSRDKLGLNRERNPLKLGREGIVWCQDVKKCLFLYSLMDVSLLSSSSSSWFQPTVM